MKQTIRFPIICFVLLFALPAFASIWVSNHTDKAYDIEIQCSNTKTSQHQIEGNTTANYSLAKKAKDCKLILKDKESKSLLSKIDAKDNAKYKIQDGGKLLKR